MSEARLRAIRASAGAGKTYELTSRYLAALRAGAAPEAILATTFTRKAAGEILGRLLQRLAQEAEGDAEAREALLRLCRSLHRVAICTLDSFFNRLAVGFRPELGLPPDAAFTDENSAEAALLRLEAIQAALEESRGAEDLRSLARLLEQLERGAARRSLTEALAGLLAGLYDVYRQAPEEAAWSRLQPPPTLDEGDLAAALAAAERAGEAASDARLAAAVGKDLERARREEWEAFLGNGLPPKLVGDGTYYRRPIPPEIAAAYEPLLRHAAGTLLGELHAQTLATYQLLGRFDRHYAELRRRRRLLLFSDLPHALRAALPRRAAAEIDYRLDSAVEHLLLDEFQDTSPEQWAVLRPFAERIAAGAGTLFCVGDAKQAIYGWRGASAEIFRTLDRALPGLAWEHRERSYRSSQVVLDAVNRVFSTLAANPALAAYPDAAARWQAGFAPHEAVHAERPGYVELLTSPAEAELGVGSWELGVSGGRSDGETERRREGEPHLPPPTGRTLPRPQSPNLPSPDLHLAFAARRIARLAAANPRAGIGVLTRKNETARELLYLLDGAGVPASGEGGGPPDDDPAVETVLAALTLADHPGHTAAGFQVAGSPLGPLLDLAAEHPAALARAGREIRRRLLAEGYAAVLADWAAALAPSCDERGVQRLQQLVALADAYDPRATLRPGDFVRHVRAARVEEPSPARVRVMTLHAAKGLEFDVVVLPELAGSIDPAQTGPRPLVIFDRPAPEEPPRAVYRYPAKAARALDPELERVYEQHCARELEESLCLLYVGMTRARHALHLLIPPRELTTKGAFKKERLTPAALLRAALAPPELAETAAGDQLLYAHGDPDWRHRLEEHPPAEPEPPRSLRGLQLLPTRSAPEGRRSWREVKPSELALGAEVDAEAIFTLGEADGRRFGTLIHAWFERISWLDEPPPDDEGLLRAGREALRGTPPDDWLPEQLPKFRAMLEQPEVRAALTRPEPEPELWRERRFAVRAGERLLHGVFDRVTLHREGDELARVELLDYKTDPFSEETAARYRPQLEAYAAALAALLGVPRRRIRGRLLFVGEGRVVEG